MGKLKILLLISFWVAPAFAINESYAQEAEFGATRTPAPVEDLVYARPFALSQGYRWSAVYDEPETDIGVIVVLHVDPKLVIPRNAPSPILYAGDRVLQALNFGHTSGHVIGLVPGAADLSTTLFWFGSTTLPSRVTSKSIGAERAQAEEAGIRPFSLEKIESVTKPAIVSTNLRALLRGELAELVLRYAPEESNLARKWRLPEAKAVPHPSQPAAVKSQRQTQEKE